MGRECTYDWTLGVHIYQLFDQNQPLHQYIEPIQDPSHNSFGGFGRVYKLALTEEGNQIWLGRRDHQGAAAVKVLHDFKWSPNRRLMLALREAWTWFHLKHKNIVPLWGITDYKNLFHGAASQLCMISPWAEFGNAEEFFKTNEIDRVKTPFLLDIARGILYLHSAQPLPIIHGDLKGSNILVTADPDGLGCRAQLTDFGLSRA